MNITSENWSWEGAYKKWFFLRFFLLLIALVLSVTLAYTTFSTSSHDSLEQDSLSLSNVKKNSGWNTFKNQQYGIEFDYPSYFKTKDVNTWNVGSDLQLGTSTPYIFLTDNFDNKNKKFHMNMGVRIAPFTVKETQSKITTYWREYKLTFPDFRTTILGGKVAYAYEDGGTHMGETCMSNNYLISAGKETLIVSLGKCLVSDEEDEGYELPGTTFTEQELKTAQDIILSFNFTK